MKGERETERARERKQGEGGKRRKRKGVAKRKRRRGREERRREERETGERERKREPHPPGRELLQPHARTPSQASHSPTQHAWEAINQGPVAHGAEHALVWGRALRPVGQAGRWGGVLDREKCEKACIVCVSVCECVCVCARKGLGSEWAVEVQCYV